MQAEHNIRKTVFVQLITSLVLQLINKHILFRRYSRALFVNSLGRKIKLPRFIKTKWKERENKKRKRMNGKDDRVVNINIYYSIRARCSLD